MQGLSQPVNNQSFFLKEYKMSDISLNKVLDSIILSDPACLDNRKTYVLSLIFSTTYSSNYSFVLLFIPIDKKHSTNSHGFFSIGGKICIIDKTLPISKLNDLFIFNKRRKKFWFEERIGVDKYGPFITTFPEEYSTWFLKCNKGKLLLVEKFCI